MAYSSEDFELALAEALKQVAKAPSERKPLYTKTLPGGRAQYPYAFTITQPDLDKPRPGWSMRRLLHKPDKRPIFLRGFLN